MADIRMLVSALTDVGRARFSNEDAFAVNDLASGKTIDASAASTIEAQLDQTKAASGCAVMLIGFKK